MKRALLVSTALLTALAPCVAAAQLLLTGVGPPVAGGGGGGGATPTNAWRFASQHGTTSGTSFDVTLNGNTLTTGKVIWYIATIGSPVTSFACSSGFTQYGPFTDAYWGDIYIGCAKKLVGGETGPFTVTWTGSVSNVDTSFTIEEWNASDFDSAATGGAGNTTNSSSSITAPNAGVRATTGPGYSLVSYFMASANFTVVPTVPVGGGSVEYNPGCVFSQFVPNLAIQKEDGLSNGADVYRTSPFTTNGGCTGASDGNMGFSLVLKP